MKIQFNNIYNINFEGKGKKKPVKVNLSQGEDKFVTQNSVANAEDNAYSTQEKSDFWYEAVLTDDFSSDEELSKLPPELLQRAREEVAFSVFIDAFNSKKLIKGFKGPSAYIDIKDFTQSIAKGEASKKLVTRVFTNSNINTVGQLGRALEIYRQPNVYDTFKKANIDFFEILGDLKSKKDMTSFPEFLLYLKYLSEEKGFENLPEVYDNFCGVIRGFGVDNLDQYYQKFYYLAPDYNNFEDISDIYNSIMFIAKTHPQKIDLLEPISAKFFSNKKLNDPEKIYTTIPEVVDTLFLQNEGQNLGDIEDYIELAISSKDYNHKAMMQIRPYFNNFEQPSDDLRFYRLMHENDISISNFNKLFGKLIISDIEPMPLIHNMKNIIGSLSQLDGMNPQLAKDFYLRFSDALNVAYNAEDSSSDVMSDLVTLIEKCKFKDTNDLLNLYNQCNQPNKRLKEISSQQLIEMVDLMKFVNDSEIKDQKKFKNIRFDNLRKAREEYTVLKAPIENFLLNKSKNLFLEETSLSIFNKYRKEFIGASEDEIYSKLFQIDKLNIKNIEEFNRKTLEMERFEFFFPAKKYLTNFVVKNEISFEDSKEEEEYKTNCYRILKTLYDPYNKEESFEQIKKLSNSKFLVKSKNSLSTLFSRFSSFDNNRKILNTFVDKKVTSYSSFEAFVQKYHVDKSSFDKLVDFVANLPEGIYFNDVLPKIEVLNQQIINSNFPLELNADNISKLTYDDLKEFSSYDKTINPVILNKLLDLPKDVNPVQCLPKTFSPDKYTNKQKIVKEIFTQRTDADNYPKLLGLLYPYKNVPEDLSLSEVMQFSYFVPDSFCKFVSDMSKTSDGKEYNMSLHSKLRIIERFLMNDIKSFEDLSKPEIKQKLDNLLNSIYNQKQLLVKKSGDGERILFNSVYDGKIIESVFEKNGMLITAVEKSH